MHTDVQYSFVKYLEAFNFASLGEIDLLDALKEFSDKYIHFLENEYKGLNLTRISEQNDFWEKQIIDSLAPFVIIPYLGKLLSEKKYVIDLGFGGGFPLLPLSVLKKVKSLRCQIIGVDSLLKRVKAVQHIADHSDCKVKCIHGRFEAVDFNLGNAMYVVKAVGPIGPILELLRPNTQNVDVCFYKAGKLFEIEEVPLKVNGLYLQNIWHFQINDSEKSDRYIVQYKTLAIEDKDLKTSLENKFSSLLEMQKNVPRRTSQTIQAKVKGKLVGLNQLI